MHEASLMNDLMDKVLKVAEENEAGRVSGITVWLGALSHMSPGHFAEHYEESSRGTIAEGAALHCETSDDIHDPNAQDILLKNIEVESD
ncbi:MAG: hydrogenase maturation nickel metallochaperone HypA [Gemmatimonadetes bacterium]|nr:hydrogenase maturation nickel metallochaperone HypA [Gemmatimonadota bacterium]